MHDPNRLTNLILANCAEVLTFAFARAGALQVHDECVLRSPTLDKVLLKLPEQRADRALMEVGTLLRLLDDTDNLSGMLLAISDPPYGFVVKPDQAREDLHFRDMTNKILHARGFEWAFDEIEGPTVRCIGGDAERWLEAQIWLIRLLSLCQDLEARVG